MVAKSFANLFLNGADKLAACPKCYGPIQQAAGFTEDEWNRLTSTECWTQAEQRKIKSDLSSAVSISMAIAGLPATPLPGAYVAAVICKLVAPCNRLLAAASAPESFDCVSALGLRATSEVVTTTREQMYALVTLFSAEDYSSLENAKVDGDLKKSVVEAQAKAK